MLLLSRGMFTPILVLFYTFYEKRKCVGHVVQDSGHALCQEEDKTNVHLIAQCSALMFLRKDILGAFTLSLDTLSDVLLLLMYAKASKRSYRP